MYTYVCICMRFRFYNAFSGFRKSWALSPEAYRKWKTFCSNCWMRVWTSAWRSLEHKWRFPEIGVPPNHPFLDVNFSINQPAVGVPPIQETFKLASNNYRNFAATPSAHQSYESSYCQSRYQQSTSMRIPRKVSRCTLNCLKVAALGAWLWGWKQNQ